MFDSALTVGTATYNEHAPGKYDHSSTSLGGPENYLLLRPGAIRRDGNLSAGVNRVYEIDVVDEGRKAAVVTLNIIVPADEDAFTPTIISGMVKTLSDFATADHVETLLRGGS